MTPGYPPGGGGAGGGGGPTGPGGYGPNPYGGAPGQGAYGQPQSGPGGPAGYGPPPGGGYGAPPGPPAKKKSALPLILGVVGGVLALGVVGTAVVMMVGKKKNVALPVDAKYLPASTKEVATQLIESSRETNESVKKAYLAAELGSEMCRPGASNPAYRLEGLGAGSPKSAKDFFFDKKNLDDASNLLQCGALLAGAMEDSYQSMIGFEDDEKDTQKHAVAIGRFHVTELPVKLGFSKQSFGPMPGFCRTDVDGDGKAEDCTDKSHGAFVKDTTWFMGPKSALEDVAKAVANPKDDLGASVAALKDAAGETEGLPVVRIRAQPKSSKEFFMSPCYWGALHSGAPFTQFLEGCFPKSVDRLVEEVDSKLKAAAYEVDGDVTKAGAFHGNIIFVGRDKDAAKDIEKDVKEIVQDWKSHVDTNEAKLIKASKDNSYSARTKKFAAVADSYFNAFKKMNVVRNGRTVKVSFHEALTAEDKTALEEAETSTLAKRVAVAEVVDALQQKKAVPEKALAKIVGESWAKYLATPPEAPTVSAKFPMSSAECKQVADRLKAVKINDVPGVEAKSAYLTHKYASCATKPPEILASQRDCLLSFKTGAQFATCAPPPGGDKPANEPPESEFGDRAKK